MMNKENLFSEFPLVMADWGVFLKILLIVCFFGIDICSDL